MRSILLGIAGAALLLTGCTTNRITNLTARSLPRSADGLYTFEASWHSDQRTVLTNTITPWVTLVDGGHYPMERVRPTQDRWEAVVPIPPNKHFINYRYKFDYQYNSIPVPRKDSKLSAPYQVEITDK